MSIIFIITDLFHFIFNNTKKIVPFKNISILGKNEFIVENVDIRMHNALALDSAQYIKDIYVNNETKHIKAVKYNFNKLVDAIIKYFSRKMYYDDCKLFVVCFNTRPYLMDSIV